VGKFSLSLLIHTEMLERRVEPGAPGRPRKENSKLSEPQTRVG